MPNIHSPSIKKKSGQAAVEYILMLVVMATVVLGVFKVLLLPFIQETFMNQNIRADLVGKIAQTNRIYGRQKSETAKEDVPIGWVKAVSKDSSSSGTGWFPGSNGTNKGTGGGDGDGNSGAGKNAYSAPDAGGQNKGGGGISGDTSGGSGKNANLGSDGSGLGNSRGMKEGEGTANGAGGEGKNSTLGGGPKVGTMGNKGGFKMGGMGGMASADELSSGSEGAAKASSNLPRRGFSFPSRRQSTSEQVRGYRGGGEGRVVMAPATQASAPKNTGPKQGPLATVKQASKGEETEDAKKLRQRRMEDYMEVEEAGCNDPESAKYLRFAAIGVLGFFILVVLINFFSSGKEEG